MLCGALCPCHGGIVLCVCVCWVLLWLCGLFCACVSAPQLACIWASELIVALLSDMLIATHVCVCGQCVFLCAHLCAMRVLSDICIWCALCAAAVRVPFKRVCNCAACLCVDVNGLTSFTFVVVPGGAAGWLVSMHPIPATCGGNGSASACNGCVDVRNGLVGCVCA